MNASVRGVFYTYACGARSGGWSKSGVSIPYSTLLYSSSNVEGPHGLDISTGVFTAGWPGTYTVTWSLMANDYHGGSGVTIYLRKNGDNIGESHHNSYYTGSSGVVQDQGG